MTLLVSCLLALAQTPPVRVSPGLLTFRYKPGDADPPVQLLAIEAAGAYLLFGLVRRICG